MNPFPLGVQGIDIILRGLIGTREGNAACCFVARDVVELFKRNFTRHHFAVRLLFGAEVRGTFPSLGPLFPAKGILSAKAARYPAAEAASSAARRGRCVIGEFRVREKMVQRFLDDRFHIVVITSRLIDSVSRFAQREHEAVRILDAGAVDIRGKSLRQLIRNMLLFLGQAASGHTHHPFIRFIRRVQIGDRAPAHGAQNRVAYPGDRSDLFQISIIQGAVTGRAHQGRLSSPAAHPEGKDTLRIPGNNIIRIAKIPHRGLQVRHTGRRSRVSAPASRVDIDKAFIRIGRKAGIGGQRRHGGVSGRVDRHDDGRCFRRIGSDHGIRIDLTGVSPVTVLRRGHIRPRDKDREGFIGRVRWGFAVGDADLIIHVIVSVILPGRLIDFRQICHRFRFAPEIICCIRTRSAAAAGKHRRAQQCTQKTCHELFFHFVSLPVRRFADSIPLKP